MAEEKKAVSTEMDTAPKKKAPDVTQKAPKAEEGSGGLPPAGQTEPAKDPPWEGQVPPTHEGEPNTGAPQDGPVETAGVTPPDEPHPAHPIVLPDAKPEPTKAKAAEAEPKLSPRAPPPPKR